MLSAVACTADELPKIVCALSLVGLYWVKVSNTALTHRTVKIKRYVENRSTLIYRVRFEALFEFEARENADRV
eukprot:6616-Heterococcus_DN1.PRE.2